MFCFCFSNSKAAKHIYCAQNVKNVRLCTESIRNIFSDTPSGVTGGEGGWGGRGQNSPRDFPPGNFGNKSGKMRQGKMVKIFKKMKNERRKNQKFNGKRTEKS